MVSGKYAQPAWTPPAEVKADSPALPDVIPGGAPNNPWALRMLAASRKAAEHALKAGRLLIEAKADCRHGDWLPLLERAANISRAAP